MQFDLTIWFVIQFDLSIWFVNTHDYYIIIFIIIIISDHVIHSI